MAEEQRGAATGPGPSPRAGRGLLMAGIHERLLIALALAALLGLAVVWAVSDAS